MARNLLNRFNYLLLRIENTIDHFFGNKFPPGALYALNLDNHQLPNGRQPSRFQSLTDILKDPFLWAVPKKRRSLEKRQMRKYGSPEQPDTYKLFVFKKDLRICPTCGNHYEANHVCNHCYLRVKAETKEMQDAVVQKLGLKPVEKDVIVLYEGETISRTSEYWKGQRIVELPKKRPQWFHKNLMQPTTQEPSDSAEVKPNELA